MENYTDLIADAIADSGVIAPAPGHLLIALAADYARSLEASPYYPEKTAEARDSVAFCVEAMGGRVARFRRATRELGRRALPRPSEASGPDDLAVYEQPAPGAAFRFAGFELANPRGSALVSARPALASGSAA